MSKLVFIALAVSAACGSSYDRKYVLPVTSSLERFEPPTEAEVLEEAGLDGDAQEPTAPPAADKAPAATPAEPPRDSDGMSEGDRALQPENLPKE